MGGGGGGGEGSGGSGKVVRRGGGLFSSYCYAVHGPAVSTHKREFMHMKDAGYSAT